MENFAKDLQKAHAYSVMLNLVAHHKNALTDLMDDCFGHDNPSPLMDYELLRPMYENINRELEEMMSVIHKEANKHQATLCDNVLCEKYDMDKLNAYVMAISE